MFILGFKLSNNSRALELPDSLVENYQSIYQYSFYVQYLNLINKQIVPSHNKCQTKKKKMLNKKHINL